jgi:hypothetical protein
MLMDLLHAGNQGEALRPSVAKECQQGSMLSFLLCSLVVDDIQFELNDDCY